MIQIANADQDQLVFEMLNCPETFEGSINHNS